MLLYDHWRQKVKKVKKRKTRKEEIFNTYIEIKKKEREFYHYCKENNVSYTDRQ